MQTVTNAAIGTVAVLQHTNFQIQVLSFLFHSKNFIYYYEIAT